MHDSEFGFLADHSRSLVDTDHWSVGDVGWSNDRNEGFTVRSELRSRVGSEKNGMKSKEQIEEGRK